jgi:hypothetical protein
MRDVRICRPSNHRAGVVSFFLRKCKVNAVSASRYDENADGRGLHRRDDRVEKITKLDEAL